MEVNPLRRVLTAKATTLVGLAMLVALVMLMVASLDSVGQAGAKPKPHPSHSSAPKRLSAPTARCPNRAHTPSVVRVGRSSSRLQGPGLVTPTPRRSA